MRLSIRRDPPWTSRLPAAKNFGARAQYRDCRDHFKLLDGGLSRDIATFLYASPTVLDADVVAEQKMIEFLSPKAGRLYPSPHCEITDTIVICDDSDAKSGSSSIILPEGHVNDIWFRGFENFRILLIHNPVNLDFEIIMAILAKHVVGTLWLIYPWSGTSSSMMPVLQKKNNFAAVLGKLSMFH